MEVTAKLRYLRIAPRKVRLVVDLVRGMPVERAITQLRFLNKAAALPVRKLIESAVANARNNFSLDPDTLVIKAITADSGPMFSRFRARAFGRAAPIRKRMTHVTVVLEGQDGTEGKKETTKKKPTNAGVAKKPVAKKPTAKKTPTPKKTAKTAETKA